MSEKKLDDLYCNCIDTATPDTETMFPCGWCNDLIGWRSETHGAFQVGGKHYHEQCYFEFLFKNHGALLEACELVIGGMTFDLSNPFEEEIKRRLEQAIAEAKGE